MSPKLIPIAVALAVTPSFTSVLSQPATVPTTAPGVVPTTLPTDPEAQQPETTEAVLVTKETPATEEVTEPAGDTGLVLKPANLELFVETTGVFTPIDALQIKPEPKAYGGGWKIISIAKQGQAYKKGDVLLEIDRTDYDLAKLAVDRELAAATARLAQTRVGHAVAIRADAIALATQTRAAAAAEKEVDWWDKVDGPQMLKQYELQVKQSADRVDDASDELDQLQKMYKSEELTNATSDIVVKRSVRDLESAKISLEMTKQRVEKSKATEYAEARQRVVDAAVEAKNALEILKAEQATHEPQRAIELMTAEGLLRETQKKSTDLAGDEKFFKIVAPHDGVAYLGELAGGNWQRTDADAVAVGKSVAAGQTVLTFIDPAKLRLEVSLTEEQAARVTAGLPAWVTPSALPELACGGKTNAPSIVNTDAGGYALHIALDGAAQTIRPGSKAAVTIDLPDAENVLTIPVALVKQNRVKVVKPDGKTESRDVLLGRNDGTDAEVVSGLTAGEKVVPTE